MNKRNSDTDDDGFGSVSPPNRYNLRNSTRFRKSPPLTRRDTKTRTSPTPEKKTPPPILGSTGLSSPGSGNNTSSSALTYDESATQPKLDISDSTTVDYINRSPPPILNLSSSSGSGNTTNDTVITYDETVVSQPNLETNDSTTIDHTNRSITAKSEDDSDIVALTTSTPNPADTALQGANRPIYPGEERHVTEALNELFNEYTCSGSSDDDISSLASGAINTMPRPLVEVSNNYSNCVTRQREESRTPHRTRRPRSSSSESTPPTKRARTLPTTKKRTLAFRPKAHKPRGPRRSPPHQAPKKTTQKEDNICTGTLKTLIDSFTLTVMHSVEALNSRFDNQRLATELRFGQMYQTMQNNSGPIATMLTPTFFSGDSSESVKQFIRAFTKYAKHLGWEQKQCLHTIPSLLTKSAALWWENLTPREKPDTFDQFCELLTSQFYTDGHRLRAQGAFHKLLQNENEGVDSYWNRISQFADDHYIDEPTLLNQFLGGLLTNIKTKVFTFNPRTLTVAHQKALYAEQATKFIAETTTTTDSQTDKLDTPCNTASNTTEPSRQTTAPVNSSNTHDHKTGYDPDPPPENTNFKCQTCHSYGHTARQCKYSVDFNKKKGTFENSRGGLKSQKGTDPNSMTFVNSKFTEGLQNNPGYFDYENVYTGYNSPDVKGNQYNGYNNPEVKTKGYNGYNSPDVKIDPYSEYSNPEGKFRKGYNSPDVKVNQYNGYSNPEVKTKRYNGYNSPDVKTNQYKGYSNPGVKTYEKKGQVNPQVYGNNFKKRFDRENQRQNHLQNLHIKANSTAYRPRTKDHHNAPLINKQYVKCFLKNTPDPHNALIDTGAHYNHLSEEFLKNNQYLRNLPRQPTNARATVADGRSVRYLYTVQAEFSIKGKTLSQKFHVCKELLSPMILGQAFLTSHKVVISFPNDKIYFNHCPRILANNDYFIPSGHVSVIAVKIPPYLPRGQLVNLQPSIPNIQVTDCLFQAARTGRYQTARIFVKNSSGSAQLVHRNQVLGVMDLVQESHLHNDPVQTMLSNITSPEMDTTQGTTYPLYNIDKNKVSRQKNPPPQSNNRGGNPRSRTTR